MIFTLKQLQAPMPYLKIHKHFLRLCTDSTNGPADFSPIPVNNDKNGTQTYALVDHVTFAP